MVTRQEINRQLTAISIRLGWWGSAERRELEKIIEPYETIVHCLNGYYENGFAMLCITDSRLLLVDKKIFYLTVEDVNLDMVSEIHYDGRLLDSSVRVYTMAKTLRFTCINSRRLRDAATYLQGRILQLRRHNHLINQEQLLTNNDRLKALGHAASDAYADRPNVLSSNRSAKKT